MRLMEKLQARMELQRLEDRYVSRKNRNVWQSNGAQYVNGEYIYECRQHVEPPPSRTSRTPKPSSSHFSRSGSSGSSSSRESSSRDSNKSRSSNKSSSSKWSLGGSSGKKSGFRW